jgi:hypothetical protein
MVVVVVGESHAECAAPGGQPQSQHSTQLAMNTSTILCASYKDAQTHVSWETDYCSPTAVGSRTARVSGLCVIDKPLQTNVSLPLLRIYWKPKGIISLQILLEGMRQ